MLDWRQWHSSDIGRRLCINGVYMDFNFQWTYRVSLLDSRARSLRMFWGNTIKCSTRWNRYWLEYEWWASTNDSLKCCHHMWMCNHVYTQPVVLHLPSLVWAAEWLGFNNQFNWSLANTYERYRAKFLHMLTLPEENNDEWTIELLLSSLTGVILLDRRHPYSTVQKNAMKRSTFIACWKPCSRLLSIRVGHTHKSATAFDQHKASLFRYQRRELRD